MSKDATTFRAESMSLMFLSEIEKHCEANGISKRKLSELTGISKVILFRLFRAESKLDLHLLAKLELGLGMQFKIELQPCKEHIVVMPGYEHLFTV